MLNSKYIGVVCLFADYINISPLSEHISTNWHNSVSDPAVLVQVEARRSDY